VKGEKERGRIKRGIATAVLVAALLFSMVGIASAASQIWYLDDETHAVTGKVMEKTMGTQSGNVTISALGEQIWLADEVAGCDVAIPAGGYWSIVLRTDSNWVDKCTISIGGYNSSSGWYDIPTSSVWKNWEDITSCIEIRSHPVLSTIYKGDYLALKINNTDTVDHKVDSSEYSSLSSPNTDPGYPVPELPTLVLTSAGLLALAGYQRIRRKN
jgi:hypothetical protein